jgi:hypothetical protein
MNSLKRWMGYDRYVKEVFNRFFFNLLKKKFYPFFFRIIFHFLYTEFLSTFILLFAILLFFSIPSNPLITPPKTKEVR